MRNRRKKKDRECIPPRKLEVGLVRQLPEGTLHGCSPDLSSVICHSLRSWLLALGYSRSEALAA
jgi:hypothetical protein